MRLTVEQQWAEWQQQHWSNPQVIWRNGWLDNGFCFECRLCCGPQPGDEPFPMALLPTQINKDIDSVFYMYDSTHACLDARGCKALGKSGCTLQREQRPPACGLFPLVLTPRGLYLYTVCPASLFIALHEWLKFARNARTWLMQFPPEIRSHIAIYLQGSILQERYIDLHVPVDLN